MREITPYGDGVSILITCENRPGHDWMSFISWYSVRQALPDASVVVSCMRGNFEMLKWCPRQRVPCFFHGESTDPVAAAYVRKLISDKLIVLNPCQIVHETLPEDLISILEAGKFEGLSPWCSEAKEDTVAAFSSVATGCGGFQPGKWIDSGGNPLSYAERFLKGNLTASERKVFTLWQKAAPLYDNIA